MRQPWILPPKAFITTVTTKIVVITKIFIPLLFY